MYALKNIGAVNVVCPPTLYPDFAFARTNGGRGVKTFCFQFKHFLKLLKHFVMNTSLFSFSVDSLLAFQGISNNVLQPAGGYGGGNAPHDQALCELFKANPEGLEVTLVNFKCTAMPSNRTKDITTGKGEGLRQFTTTIEGNFQQKGTAEVKVGGKAYTCQMHVPTALAFGTSEKLVLIGQVGEITIGTKMGQMWLSLRTKEPFEQSTLSGVANEVAKSMVIKEDTNEQTETEFDVNVEDTKTK